MQRNEFNFPKMGFGCVNLTTNNNEIIDEVIKSGCNLFDTADCYGGGQSEIALGQKFKSYKREDVIICTKVGLKFLDGPIPKIDGSKTYIKAACEASLKRLQVDYIDLLQLHRADPKIPVEESMHALKELVETGKIKAIGLSEVTASQIRRAHKIYPISAVQIEYSPWARQDEDNDVISTCNELGINVIAYSPLGRAIFTNTDLSYFTELPEHDYRKTLPRYVGENLEKNLETRESLKKIALSKGCTLAQLVLAWEIHKGFIPIPATTNKVHFDENYHAINIHFTASEVDHLDELIKDSIYHGDRYLDEQHSAIYAEASATTFWNKNRNSILSSVGMLCMAGILAYRYLSKAPEPDKAPELDILVG